MTPSSPGEAREYGQILFPERCRGVVDPNPGVIVFAQGMRRHRGGQLVCWVR